MKNCGLHKSERLCSRTAIDRLFEPGSGSRSISAFPLRLVYGTAERQTAMLVSVPKRYFRHAVDRNRVKRQVREAYRRNKHILPEGSPLHIAFIWLDSKHYPTHVIHNKVCNLLQRCSEKL